MNTSTRAGDLLRQALASGREAEGVVSDLIVAHDYQDVALLVTQAANALLESAALLMESDGETAFDRIEQAEDLLDTVYSIIESELDEDE